MCSFVLALSKGFSTQEVITMMKTPISNHVICEMSREETQRTYARVINE
jgi:hypothetical protein